ncbi:MAG: DinB family protein [Anaerolineales bacterium]
MLREYLIELYDFTCWGRDLLLDKAENLTAEQFDQDTRFPIHTIKETLVHVLTAELAYRKRASQEPYLKGLEKSEFPDLKSMRAYWAAEEKLMRAFLATLNDDAIGDTLTYKTTAGDEVKRRRIDLIFQLYFHGMQHRAEMAQMLTEFGHSPGNIDYSVYKYG